jgi:hypothetical protein
MLPEHTARVRMELRPIGKTSSSADPVLQHVPEAFHGMEVMSAPGWQKIQPHLLVPVGPRRRQRVRPVHTTAADDHDDLFLRVAKDGHHLMHIVAKPLRIALGNDLVKDFRGAIVDGAKDAEARPHW